MESATEDEPPVRRWTRSRILVLAGRAALVLLLVAILGPIAWRFITRENVALTTPGKVAGLTLDTSDDARQTMDYLRTAVAAKISLTSTVGAVHQDPARQDRKGLMF